MSAIYDVDPSTCATKLGRWLAETVKTTRFDDDLSACKILLPQTEEGLHVRELAEKLMQRQAIASVGDADSLYADIESWISLRRAAVKTAGSIAFQHRVVQY